MVTSQNTQPQPSRTAQITRDTVGLGRTPGQRGAEVIAGIRAELSRSPEAAALSRTGGRIFARVLIRLGQNRDIFQFIPARMEAMSAIIGRSIPKDKPDPLIVEIASGFSPRPLHIAREFPKATVIEVDLPDVVAEKQRRLKYGGIQIPPNLNWLTADLGMTNLSDVLGGRKADLISSEGLTLYFSPEEIMRMNRHLRESLSEGGVYITEIYYRDKFAEARQLPNLNSAIAYFLRQAGNIPGLAADDVMARTWFTEAGFSPVESYDMPTIFKEIKVRAPLLDIAAIIVAHNSEKPAQLDTTPKGKIPTESPVAVITPSAETAPQTQVSAAPVAETIPQAQESVVAPPSAEPTSQPEVTSAAPSPEPTSQVDVSVAPSAKPASQPEVTPAAPSPEPSSQADVTPQETPDLKPPPDQPDLNATTPNASE